MPVINVSLQYTRDSNSRITLTTLRETAIRQKMNSKWSIMYCEPTEIFINYLSHKDISCTFIPWTQSHI